MNSSKILGKGITVALMALMLSFMIMPAFALKATSCDADAVCEANNVNVGGSTQTNGLTATQAAIATAFVDFLTANKLIAAQATITTAFINFLTATQARIGKILIAGNTISTAPDFDLILQPATKKVVVNDDITANRFITKSVAPYTGLDITGNKISNNTASNEPVKDIDIESSNNININGRNVILNSSGGVGTTKISVEPYYINGYATEINLNGYFIRLNATGPASHIELTTPKVVVSSLTGSGNAYVCVDSTGVIYRSLVPCV